MYLIIKLKRKDMKGSDLNNEVSGCSYIDCVLLWCGCIVSRKVKCVGCLDDDVCD